MIEEKILLPILDEYYNTEDLSDLIRGFIKKERVGFVGNIEIWIYSIDHEPPHFHVKTKDNSIDAKFLIKDGTFLSGDIKPKDIKKIDAFFNDMKTQIVMKKIWDKRYK